MTYPIDLSIKPDVSAHFDAGTNTISYIVKDPAPIIYDIANRRQRPGF
ncbi:hypothetical protein RA2_03845 [Roseovarius sp. A-2]|nr:hypothetical protein RA2_03845 [Roseovarius sp. A-2]